MDESEASRSVGPLQSHPPSMSTTAGGPRTQWTCSVDPRRHPRPIVDAACFPPPTEDLPVPRPLVSSTLNPPGRALLRLGNAPSTNRPIPHGPKRGFRWMLRREFSSPSHRTEVVVRRTHYACTLSRVPTLRPIHASGTTHPRKKGCPPGDRGHWDCPRSPLLVDISRAGTIRGLLCALVLGGCRIFFILCLGVVKALSVLTRVCSLQARARPPSRLEAARNTLGHDACLLTRRGAW
jgi:hypothetical protein